MLYRLTDLMEGALNYIQEYGNIKSGEEVFILAETAQDPLLPEPYAAAARAIGAKVPVLVLQELRPKFGNRSFEDQRPALDY